VVAVAVLLNKAQVARLHLLLLETVALAAVAQDSRQHLVCAVMVQMETQTVVAVAAVQHQVQL
jgi:hypothetical protein